MHGTDPVRPILLVEDDRGLGAWLASRIGLLGLVCWTRSCAECERLLARTEACAVIIEARLDGDSSLSLARQLGEAPGSPPVLLLAERGSWSDNTSAFRSGAEYLTKAPDRQRLLSDVLAFLERRIAPATLRSLVAPSYCARRGLTARQIEVIRLAVADLPRKLLAEKLGLSENSVKSHIRAALRRTGATDLADLRAALDRYATERARRIAHGEAVATPTFPRKRRRSGVRRKDGNGDASGGRLGGAKRDG